VTLNQPKGDIMHPMFVKLFVEPDPDDPLTGEDEMLRRSRRARRHRSPMLVRASPYRRERQPRR
jgi:hypothetical protein